MDKSTDSLAAVVTVLTTEARRRGLTDTQWAEAAGVRKETLSRLRRRKSCDYATLEALASATGLIISIVAPAQGARSENRHFPERVDREYEAQLVALCRSGNLDPQAWRAQGPAFFMAGLSVVLASVTGFDRSRLLALAEVLHPGSSYPDVFSIWLAHSPLRPSRFLPLVRASARNAA